MYTGKDKREYKSPIQDGSPNAGIVILATCMHNVKSFDHATTPNLPSVQNVQS